MNIEKYIIDSIEERRAETKTPCKSYATQARAEKTAASLAQQFANHFAIQEKQHPCRYIVAHDEAWGRWIVAFDFTEMLRRDTSTGGYIGIASDIGFYTY
tara:strand:+ start:490 stop:789 length:300 start_codon:yes stop_codon:yes gene_type:complete